MRSFKTEFQGTQQWLADSFNAYVTSPFVGNDQINVKFFIFIIVCK